MNITLIGMSGAGKSHIGRRLAKRRGLEFIDTDDILEEKYGKPIQSLLDEWGEERYLDVEAEAIRSATAGKDAFLLSPGGSIIYRPDAMEHARGVSKVIYLYVPFETIEGRMIGRGPRAIIGLGRKSLRQLYDERAPQYERAAHLIIDTESLDLDGVLDHIDLHFALTDSAQALQ